MNRLDASPIFDSMLAHVLPVDQFPTSSGTSRRTMADNNAIYAIRHNDGSISLYIDEDYARDRGIDPATLTRVEIPRELYVSGSIQQVREYVATYLEAQITGTA